MTFATDSITVLAVLLPALQSDWPTPTWFAMAVLCICGWAVIALDIRRPQKRERVEDRGAVAPRSTRTDVIF